MDNYKIVITQAAEAQFKSAFSVFYQAISAAKTEEDKEIATKRFKNAYDDIIETRDLALKALGA
ncbi:MAG: hypothetical protein AAF212_00860 [Verrucomicrobiota bacterium]